ncbi:putative protein required for cell protein [Hirsutella rhossiliensis]|uniref:Protein required for cell viability n=1 Tax=Hirsutella rhossiliensis TaxID=111463 RepID=A0A9P8MRY2_9HYPO|nr:putative protein required for cell protein [Hirsutella rhossiliensis]KAH0960818.1 putative protein required for cell protein [Hirsutella rhossiliensis]
MAGAAAPDLSNVKIAQEILEAGKKAFDPQSSPTSREARLQQYNDVITKTATIVLLPTLNALIKPDALPKWLRDPLLQTLTLLPLRPDGVRATLEFVFAVHPSSNAAADSERPQKSGASITHEAVALATRLLSSVPSSFTPEAWFEGIASQTFDLLDGKGGPELAKTLAQIVGFGILGKKQFGAPGAPGWNIFVQPLLELVNPSLGPDDAQIDTAAGTSDAEVVDLALSRLNVLVLSNPSPGLCRRVLRPVILQLWALCSWMNAPRAAEQRFSSVARGLVRTHLRLAGACSSDEVAAIFLHLLRRWIASAQKPLDLEVHITPQGHDAKSSIQDLVEVTLLQKLMHEAPGKLVNQFRQLVDVICQVLKADGRSTLGDDIVAVALSLLNLVITAPSFQKSDFKPDELETIGEALDRIGNGDRPDVSTTARNLEMLLKYRDDLETAENFSSVRTARQVEDQKTYSLAMNYMTGERDNPPPVISEGLNLLSNLIVAESPILDITAVTVLMADLLKENEDYINLRVIKVFTQLANKHPRSTVQELLDNYLDANEKASTDTRLRFGEALVQVIERLGETFSDEVAKQVCETLLSIAGRRGYRPKTMADQARRERLRNMKKQKGGDDADQHDEISDDEAMAATEGSNRDMMAQIIQGWESKRGSEDVRMRASSLSILGSALETHIVGIEPTIVSSVVDLCVHVLAMEREVEYGIVRRAAVRAILSFVKALDEARESNRTLGFGLTEASRADIQRTLTYVAETDNDGLVQQHARDVVESLGNWRARSLLPQHGDRAAPGLGRLAGLQVSLGGGPVDESDRRRPMIEEVE